MGIDATPDGLEVARAHAASVSGDRLLGSRLEYVHATAEEVAADDQSFDVVVASEVIEHVDDMAMFVRLCCSMVRPGGLFFASTMNRTPQSYAMAVVVAENVLNLARPGTPA